MALFFVGICLFSFLLVVPVVCIFCCRLCLCCIRSRRTAEPDVPLSQSSRVRSVSAVCNGADGSITIEWVHQFRPNTVTGYEIYYGRQNCDRYQRKNVKCSRRRCTLTQTTDSIQPLLTYMIWIRPILSIGLQTEWVSTTVFVAWHCQLPGCTSNRQRRNNTFSRCCSAGHAEIFNANYCLFPECTVKCRKHFCKNHLQKAVTEGICGFVKVDSTSYKYAKLERKFSSSWSLEKGRVPEIYCILQIINPSAKKRFDKYKASLPWVDRYVEPHYHGTQLKCDVLQHYEPCTVSMCGVCGIAKMGFDPQKINTKVWQRFGKGFYFARNSSKAYEYPLACRQNDSVNESCRYRCVLVCDVAVGCKKSVYYDDPTRTGPPSGYHSIHGKSRWLWFWKSPDLNYDELVVYDADAIKPCYILFCENTMQ